MFLGGEEHHNNEPQMEHGYVLRTFQSRNDYFHGQENIT